MKIADSMVMSLLILSIGLIAGCTITPEMTRRQEERLERSRELSRQRYFEIQREQAYVFVNVPGWRNSPVYIDGERVGTVPNAFPVDLGQHYIEVPTENKTYNWTVDITESGRTYTISP